MSLEGGFAGRTNKLVDGCYSFWQGGVGCLLELYASKTTHQAHQLFNRITLQNFVFACCQAKDGGLRDKPEKYSTFLSRRPDYYHTCYCLSGLSLCQNHYVYVDKVITACPSLDKVGPDDALLSITHPVYNIRMDRVDKMIRHFSNISII